MLGRCLKSFAFNKVIIIRLTLTSHIYFSRNIASLISHHIKFFSHSHHYSCGIFNKSGCSRSFIRPLPFFCVHQKRSSSSQFNETHSSSENYTELYLINNIRFFRLLCRFSRYSFLTFLFGSPLCIASSFLDMFSIESLRMVFSCLAFYMIIFTGQSFFLSSRIVAKIMISPNRDMVKISHLTLFGNRTDVYLQPSDIVKFQHFGGELMSKNMVLMKFKKPCKQLIFLPGHGGIDTNYQALEILLCSDSTYGE